MVALVVLLEGGEVVIINGGFGVVGIGLKNVVAFGDAAIIILDRCGSVVAVYRTDVVLKQQLLLAFWNLTFIEGCCDEKDPLSFVLRLEDLVQLNRVILVSQ